MFQLRGACPGAVAYNNHSGQGESPNIHRQKEAPRLRISKMREAQLHRYSRCEANTYERTERTRHGEENHQLRVGRSLCTVSSCGIGPCESTPNRKLSVTPSDAGCLKAKVVCTVGAEVPYRSTSGTRSGGAISGEAPGSVHGVDHASERGRLVGRSPRRVAGRYPDWTWQDILGRFNGGGRGSRTITFCEQ